VETSACEGAKQGGPGRSCGADGVETVVVACGVWFGTVVERRIPDPPTEKSRIVATIHSSFRFANLANPPCQEDWMKCAELTH